MNKKKNKKVIENKPEIPIFPEREPLTKSEKSPKEVYETINKNYDLYYSKYLTEEEREIFLKNFKIFDRDYDEFINLEQLKELLVSVKYKINNNKFLEDYYNIYEKENQLNNKKGITEKEFLTLILFRKKENDIKQDLVDAFEFLNLNNKENDEINSEKFRDYLMYHGYCYSEEQVNNFMSFADPKNTGKFKPDEFIEKISNREIKKKKRGKKKNK